MNRVTRIARHIRAVLWTVCLCFVVSGCVTYRAMGTPGTPLPREDLRLAEPFPPMLLVHQHSHLINGTPTKQAGKSTKALYDKSLEKVLGEFPFLKQAGKSRFDAGYSLRIESVNDERANMGLVYLSGATLLVLPSKARVAMTVSAKLTENGTGRTIATASSKGGCNVLIWLPLLLPWNMKAGEAALADVYRDVFVRLEDQIRAEGFTEHATADIEDGAEDRSTLHSGGGT